MTLPDGRGRLIQVRHDTAADWASVDPILGRGEPGWDEDNQLLKIGDGVTPWSGLPAAQSGAFAPLTDPTFAGEVTISESFTNPFDGDLYVGGEPRVDPAAGYVGGYFQSRVSGDMGGFVHEAIVGELRISGASNTDFLIGIEATTVITGGANTIADQRGITVSSHFEGTPSGTITLYTGVAIQDQHALTGTLAVTTARGLWVDGQTRATNNYGVVIDASSTQTLWVSADANNTTAAAGIAFGLSRDTTLYRSAVNSLTTGGTFVCGALTVPNITINDAGGVRSITAVNNGLKIGAATTNKIGFWNATPTTQPAAVADATDAASVITQLNALLSRLRTIGVIAT